MKTINHPKWLIFANTLPFALLIFLMYSQYDTVSSLLSEEKIHLWATLAWVGGCLFIAHQLFTLYALLKRKSLGLPYVLVSVLLYLGMLYFCYYSIDDLMPFNIPDWMVTDFFPFYPISFLMPTLLHTLFIGVASTVDEQLEEQKAWQSLVAAIAVPLLVYIFSILVFPSFRFESEFAQHAIIVLGVLTLVAFIFLLMRLLYQVSINRSGKWGKYNLIWKIPVCLILPVLGLLINQGALFSDSLHLGNKGLFGDFSSPWFYVCAISTGLLLCIPPVENPRAKIALLLGKSIAFAYTSYFFFVFMPFIPLAFVAIFAFGLGLLMLSPLALMFLHFQSIYEDLNALKAHYSRTIRYATLIIGLLTIPLIITIHFNSVKNNMSEALAFVEAPSLIEKQNHINTTQLKKTLQAIKHNKKRRRGELNLDGRKMPFISAYFSWFVMDNLMLSQAKIEKLEAIFFDKDYYRNGVVNSNASQDIIIKDAKVSSTYDTLNGYWTSLLHLELENTLERGLAEFSTIFELPDDAFINDYYLYVGDKKEPGILTEKKAAQWIYNQIRNRNRDPGLLVYEGMRYISFKIFPFQTNEVRKTGIQFIHKQPFVLDFYNQSFQIGDSTAIATSKMPISIGENYYYVDGNYKNQLPKIERKPYYHFILDASKGQEDEIEFYASKINELLAKKLIPEGPYQVSYTHAYSEASMHEGTFIANKNLTCNHGFYVERALQKTFLDSYHSSDLTFPVPVVLTGNIHEAIMDKNTIAKLENTIPELDVFYLLGTDNELIRYDLTNINRYNHSRKFYFNTVLAYPNDKAPTAFLKDNSMGEGFSLKGNHNLTFPETTNTWEIAMQQQAIWKQMCYRPNTLETHWMDLLKSSFESKVMSPINAYMVVENEAQQKMLLKKQQQVINGNKLLDLESDEPMSMSEPSMLWLLLAFFLIGFKRRREVLYRFK